MQRDAILNKDIFFDTAIIKNILKKKNPEVEKAFWDSIRKRNFYSNNTPFFVSTKTMLFECLGYKKPELNEFFRNPELNSFFINYFRDDEIKDLNSLLEKLHPYAEKYVSSQQNFLKRELLKRLQLELPWMSEFGQGFLEEMFQRNISTHEFETELIQKIAFEFILNFDFRTIGLSEERKIKIIHDLISLVRFMLIEGYNGFSFTRPLDRILVEFANSKEVLDSYRDYEEHLDTEIVHFVTVGSHQSGSWNSVAVFTSENIMAWKERIKRYLAFLDVILKNDSFVINPGTIYVVNTRTGHIVDSLDVCGEFRSELKNLRLGKDQFLK